MKKPRSWSPQKYAAIVIDANTDAVLFSRNADSRRYPASLTKMMTLYIVFNELESGRLRKQTLMSVSQYASDQVPSSLQLQPGDRISVEDAICALVTKSANDVAVVVAEHISGSERAFARRMTATARGLGMKSTVFRNASGLHDPKHHSTARDMSILSQALYRNHPEYSRYFSLKSFAYGEHYYGNHNKLLGVLEGIDGIKTGYTSASGYNLASSLRRGNRHLIAVVMGGPSGNARNSHMRHLLTSHILHAATTQKFRRWHRVGSAQLANAPLPPIRPWYQQDNTLVPTPVVLGQLAQSRSISLEPQGTHGASIPLPVLSGTDIGKDTVGQEALADFNKGSILDAASHGPNTEKRWMIQIGAYDQKAIAQARLNEALLQHSGLKNRLGYTEPVRKDDVTLYRARFEGFDREDARQTCNHLRRAKFKCLPMMKE